MTARITPLRPHEQSIDQRVLAAAITGGPRAQGPQHFPLTADDGSLRGPFDGFLRSPAVGTALQELGASIRYCTGFTDRARELAILLVAARRDSDFERESHEAIARALGFTPTEIASIRALDVAGFPNDEALVGRVVIALLDGDLNDELWERASAGLGDGAIFELTTLVGYYSTLALQLRVFRVES
jgi:4-carboxymuconolactone decarboxylase